MHKRAERVKRQTAAYWFTYNPGPDGKGAHEGDWEHITVYLDRGGKPRQVFYATHNEGTTRSWLPDASGKEVVSRAGDTHPIVHLAEGSHASYPNCIDTKLEKFGIDRAVPDDVGCPPPGRAAPAYRPRGFTQLGPRATDVRRFEQWVCWRGRVGEQGGPTEAAKGAIGIRSPEMPYLQDEVVRAGVWSVLRRTACDPGPEAGPATARAAQAPGGATIRPIAGQVRTPDGFAKLARCESQDPGPEPGRTLVTLCAPALLERRAQLGLEPDPAARRVAPFFAGRTRVAELTGEPVALRTFGGLETVDGVMLTNRAGRTQRVRLTVTSWPSGAARARTGVLTLRLRPGTRLRTTARSVRLRTPGGRTIAVPLRERVVIEDR